MQKTLGLIFFLAICCMAFTTEKNTAYQFKVKSIDGGEIDLSTFRGKKILVVNTASKCGFTPQYEGLQALYEKYEGKLVVIGFPANNFLSQEPGSNAEIQEFCTSTFHVTFPMAAKVSVKGKDMAPLFKWLTEKSQNGVMDATISWNFNKFLLDENGKLLQHFGSKVKPDSEEISRYLQ